MSWRREWDSNPRYAFTYTRFPSVRLKPLGHPSGARPFGGGRVLGGLRKPVVGRQRVRPRSAIEPGRAARGNRMARRAPGTPGVLMIRFVFRFRRPVDFGGRLRGAGARRHQVDRRQCGVHHAAAPTTGTTSTAPAWNRSRRSSSDTPARRSWEFASRLCPGGADLAGARHHRLDLHPDRPQEEAADRLRPGLTRSEPKKAAAVRAAARSAMRRGDYLIVSAPALQATRPARRSRRCSRSRR